MALMSLKQVRVVDPILTSIVTGYNQPDFVGDFLFPEVEVTARTGAIIEFGKEDFALFDTRRAPGARTKRRSIQYSSKQYSLYQDAIEGELPIEHVEEADGSVGLNLQRETAESAMYSIKLRLEYDQAKLATDPTKYDAQHKVTLSGASKFSDPGSSPKTLANAWREAIRATTGVYPNSAIIGAAAFNALDRNPEIRDQFKYTSDNSLTEEMLARYFNLSRGVKVGTAVTMDEATGSLTDVWGNNMVLAYVPRTVTSRRMPSYGYTYRLRGYPVAERPYYDENHRTWYFPAIAERAPQMTSMAAGFLAMDVA